MTYVCKIKKYFCSKIVDKTIKTFGLSCKTLIKYKVYTARVVS